MGRRMYPVAHAVGVGPMTGGGTRRGSRDVRAADPMGGGTAAGTVLEARPALGVSEAGAPVESLSRDLEATVTRCAAAVRSAAARHGLAGEEIDEVFQEVRIRLWRALSSGEGIRGVTASYVYKTATSAALDSIRRRRARREGGLDAHAEVADRREGRDGPQRALARSETTEAIECALESLLDSRRPVVRMYLAGYKLSEITELLGGSSHRTRNLLYRGLADLRTALGDMGVTSWDAD